ncbi:hypothetical protein D1816_04655 [Aquimarina sp. AD10]|uniref:leucine-rich repeat domain-containing protein n=1 Tax=Aquimarina sp. AD10 TaxID=1714849 RepID=UPI000E4CC7EB|nr:DUF5018 domain-containing protein [Aquimarina sp. AD10]AXT59675.1 hypothetical protein D1816_04655 [Aquimarina sp. AD10]RKM97551.1 hypothetical protein D7033_14235 [Aquimarina sp. AD10]
MRRLELESRDIFSKSAFILLFLSVLLTSCSSGGDDTSGEELKSSDKRITSFLLATANNATLSQNITGTINEDNKTIDLVVPFGISLTSLAPSITISDKAQISPDSGMPRNFASPVTFTVTAEDGTEATYTVTITNAQNSEKRITAFSFTVDMNPSVKEDIDGTIDESNKTITLNVPFGAAITALIPTIELSDGASSTPSSNTAIDFSSAVNFEVSAQDNSTTSYTVTVTRNESDYATLRAIYDANPGNTLSWDFNNLDISTYEGVNSENDRVTALTLTAKGLTVLPSQIGDLSMLSLLYLQNNGIESIPAEISNLSQTLTQFLLSNNPLKSIPTQIGTLTNLEFLDLFNTDITTIPSTIGNLNNLISLNLSQNFDLTGLPSEIGNLDNLTRLSLIGANYPIPTEIGNLSNLTFLNLSNADLSSFPTQVLGLTDLTELYLSGNTIATVPTGIGNLTNLSKLFLDSNSLTSLPTQIANLSNLTELNITNNTSLISIPQVICDLADADTTINKDAATSCM